MGTIFFKQTVRDVPLDHKTVLVRADYNVPLQQDGTIRDDLRIRASVPTLEYLLDRGCKIVIVSHLGRPDGQKVEKYSLRPVAERLAELLGREVRLAGNCVGDQAYQAVKAAGRQDITLFENVRFHAEEEKNDELFAKQIAKASQASYFVQDGFGVVHRAHATTDAITHYLPAVAGLLVEREYTSLASAVESPARPLTVIMGGAKVSDKVAVIERFVERADTILVGGAMANTFLAYEGNKVGKSIHETNQRPVLDKVYAAIKKKMQQGGTTSTRLMIPVDVAVSKAMSPDEPRRIVAADAIGKDDIALDIGPETIESYVDIIKQSKTVVWNGPAGYTEYQNFAHGSARIALALATTPGVTSIIGGGDTADFILKWDGHDGASFTHVSTGGGAGLDLMAGKRLPGVESLLDARH